MEKINVKIGWSGDNYSCVADGAALNGIISVTDKTLEGLKKKFQESLQFHIEGCIQDGDPLPEWLINKRYELNYTLEISALLHSFDGILTRSAIARVSGIKEKQIGHYRTINKMKKIFENVSELTTRRDYDLALSYVKKLITEATLNGALSEPEADNEYVREIGRVGHLCAVYEDTQMEFEHITVRKKSPMMFEYA